MSAICFRCDWQGPTAGSTCPSCATPLHRVEVPRRVRDREREFRGSEDDAREWAFGPESVLGSPPRPDRSGFATVLGPVVLIGVIALLALAAIEAVSADDRTSAARQTVGETDAGKLAYLARSPGGGAQLWILDVATGRAEPGPFVPPTTVELVDASVAGPDRIGVERLADDGTVRVSVIQGIGPGAQIDRLGRGDLVAWGPGGSSLVIARNASGPDPCTPVRMSLVSVVTQEVGWSFHDRSFCGPVTSLSRSAAATYLTAPSGDRYGVYLTGDVGVPHLLFEGVALVSGSPLAAFLLRGVGNRDDAPQQGSQALLGWKGIGGPVSIGRGDQALVVERVLAWSPDGAQVAVLGALGQTRGVFVVEAGSGTGQRVPTFVELEEEASDATFDAEGSLYLVAGEGLFVYRAGAVTALPVPDGIPRPAGAIVWIP